MLCPGLSLLLGLCVASLLPLRVHGCPSRNTARLNVSAQDVQQPDTGTGSASLWLLQVRCCTFLALSLLLTGLCLGCSLRRKAERQHRELKACTRSAWPRTCCLADCSPLHDEVLGQQKENSASIKSWLRHLRRRCLRGDMLRRGRSKKVWKDLDEEEALFSDCENTC